MAKSLPLEGVRVLDLSRVLALPFATMILSDLGAEIIKVEKPGSGDETRGWGPPFLGEESAYFLCVNRNKKSIAVDIAKPQGQQIIKDIAKRSDVLVENFKVGGLKKYSLDYNSIKKVNPKIIYCSLTGFGQYGPRSGLPGYDFIIQGLSGLMSITGFPNGQPLKVGVAITDVVAGLYATVAILSSLFKRERVSQSEYIDLALYDTAVSALVNVASNYLVGGKIPKRYGNAHPNIVPYQTFKAKDRYFNLAVGNDKQFERLVELLEDETLKQDRFKTNAGRVENRRELVRILQKIFENREADYWVKLFQENDIPSDHIHNLEDVFNDPHFVNRGMIREIEHKYGNLKLVYTPINFRHSATKQPEPPPLLGEHTDEVLKSILGYSAVKIEELRKSNIVA